MVLVFMEFLWSIGLDGRGSSFQVHCPLSSPPTCGTGISRVPFLCLGVCQSLGSSRTSGQNAVERLLVTGGPTRSGLLQLAVSSVKGIGGGGGGGVGSL